MPVPVPTSNVVDETREDVEVVVSRDREGVNVRRRKIANAALQRAEGLEVRVPGIDDVTRQHDGIDP